MSRRIVAASILLAAVGWGLWTLHGVFAEERQEATAAVDARRRVLDRHAADGFERRLAQRLAEARPAIERAVSDPLASTDGIGTRQGHMIIVPPQWRHAKETLPAPGGGPVGWALYETLLDPESRQSADGPWGERLALRAALIDAVGGGDAVAIEAAMRAFLGHRLRHVLAPTREIPSTLAVVRWFADAADADPRLLRAVLYDGFDGPDGAAEGLQRALLRHRNAFSADDFVALCDAVVALSARGDVPRDAFEQNRRPRPGPPLPLDVPAPTLSGIGNWYVAPDPSRPGRVDAVRFDPEAERAALEAEMRRGALLEPDEALRFDPWAAVPISVHSPDWVERPARARATWRLKVGLLWSCALLAVAVVGLVLLDVRRRRRFVELKNDFIAAVSHELRTPLAAIRLMAETLERRLVDVPRARDYPARIVREVDGLGFLVENLLSFNRIDKGRWVARRRPIALAEVVHHIREGIEAAFDRPITWRLDGLDRRVDADPALLELMLANLVRNAVQHSAGPLTLAITAAGADPVTLRIADDGPGIPDEARRHVFEAFYRGPARTSRGSGLGLALCRRIAGLHGGRLELAATGPGGTTFAVELPAARDERSEA